MLIVARGASGLIKAIEQCWPASDRQHCPVHRERTLPEAGTSSATRTPWSAAIFSVVTNWNG
jgi:transposase-like protein